MRLSLLTRHHPHPSSMVSCLCVVGAFGLFMCVCAQGHKSPYSSSCAQLIHSTLLVAAGGIDSKAIASALASNVREILRAGGNNVETLEFEGSDGMGYGALDNNDIGDIDIDDFDLGDDDDMF